MKTYHSWEELIEAYEHDMLRLEEDKTDCFAIYDHIREHINTCLAQKSYDSLSELLPYLNPSKPYPKFHHNGATMKIYFLLNALNAELKYNTCIFMSSASDYEQLLSQYALTVFAMRRLELAFSTQAMEEAKTYLTSIPFSVYTASYRRIRIFF